MKNKSICLNMIVKNESQVIQRCLASVKEIIDYWVIVDTGSTDQTPAIIQEFLRDIPGEIYERSWVHFAHNRNEALELARGKADYILFIDADDCLVFSESFVMPELDKDCYYVTMQIKSGSLRANNIMVLMIKDLPDFQWVGTIHEALFCHQNKTTEILSGVVNQYNHDGDRAQDSARYVKDIEILKNELALDPTNSRNVFYLAKAYLAMNDCSSAIQSFEKRASMNGDPDEKFYSLYLISYLQKTLQMNSDIFIESFCTAYQYDPTRIEPLYELTNYFIQTENYFLGFLVSRLAQSIRCPHEKLFIEPWQYDWGALFQFYICARHTVKKAEAMDAFIKLISNPNLPPNERSSLEKDAINF